MNVYEKLNAVRKEFLAKERKKSGKNSYAGYDYFELSDFLPDVLTLFAKNGLCGHFSARDGLAILEVINTEKTDEKIVFSSPLGSASLKGCHEIQNIGACITYARRYLWGCVIELIENDALDSSDTTEPDKTSDQEYQDDWTYVYTAMGDASTLEELKAIFGPAWNKAKDNDKLKMEKEYKRLKAILEKKQ